MLDWGKVRFFWAEVAQNFTRNYTMALTAIVIVGCSSGSQDSYYSSRSASNEPRKSSSSEAVKG
jgi:hypothetical protein